MKWRITNARRERWLTAWLSVVILWLAARPAQAASSAETRLWETACRQLQAASGPTMWGLAQTNFAQFIQKYPNSEHYPDAVVFEGRALFEQGKFVEVIDLLSTQAARADGAADRFTYWTAKSFFEIKNFAAAADAYARLVHDNPGSPLRLEAVFREAEANARLERWPRVIEDLQDPAGAFQQMVKTNQTDDLAVSGLLLLGKAQLEQKNYAAAEKTLAGIQTQPQGLHPEREWDRQSLLCQTQLGSGQMEAALRTSTNLLAAAADAGLKARSILLQGEILEQLGQLPAAVKIYQTNLSADLPLATQRQAALRIVELLLRQKKADDAAKTLSDFFARHPDDNGADFELLLLGELKLRQHFEGLGQAPASAIETNLQAAENDFTKLLTAFTNSEYRGKAELNLGWCFWAEGRIPQSELQFSNALIHLPFSEDQAVARFKLADIFFQKHNLAGALANYSAIPNEYASLPGVKRDLLEQALYQMVRVSLEQNDPSAATNALNKILAWFPNGELADNSLLLVGQAQKPAQAREIFSTFEAKYPQSELLPEVKLAVARTYENEMNYAAAIAQYDAWVREYTNSPVLARAQFSRAWAYSESGDQSNAFVMFTNFVAQYQTNEFARSNDLPAKAQNWVGDYYWGEQDFQKAELSYKKIFTEWPDSPRAFQARMMAGHAAIASQRPQDAIVDFTNLAGNPNCPADLAAQASFANGDATLALPLESNTNKYSDAINIFRSIATHYTNSPIAALAWCRYGDCYFALPANEPAQYETASNAFQKVMVMEPYLAGATTRSMAELRLGQTLEALAALQPAAAQKPLLNLALEHFFNVFSGGNLQDKEAPDPYWTKEAGLEAARLAEQMGEWRQAITFYESLRKSAPALETVLQKRIAKAQDNLAVIKK